MDDMVGGSSMDNSIGQSMFDTIGQPPKLSPSADQMADAMKRLQINRKVEMKEVCVRTYDLSIKEDVEKYQLDLEHILLGLTQKTHVILCRPPPQFVSDDKSARYIAHMQWVEYVLVETPVPTTSASKGINHG